MPWRKNTLIDYAKALSVGALLYSPALNHKIADMVIQGRLRPPYSLALCLEDTISDSLMSEAERQVAETVRRICDAAQAWQEILTGFVFPKYTLDNAAAYHQALLGANDRANHPLYMMPILESREIVDFRTRRNVLGRLKEQVDAMAELVLNVRVGGNDFSNAFAARRHYDETIYDILPIAQLLGEILTVFSLDYVVSGPVWEFFFSDNDEWKQGLRQELKLDRLNGFVGKTVIHPKQIPVVNEMLKVTRKDYEDAKTILNWDDGGLLVGKSYGGERMNEVRTHGNWAKKTLLLSELYGIV